MAGATLYDVLGIAPDADAAEVRAAYLALARRHHPDRTGGDAARMRVLNEAWATLGDPARRQVYDLTLRGPLAAAGHTGAPFDVDADDDLDDLEDDRPIGLAAPPSGWFAVVPVGLFAASVGLGVVGVLLGLPAVVGFSVLVFALSCLAFVAAPLVSLYLARRGTGVSPPGGRR